MQETQPAILGTHISAGSALYRLVAGLMLVHWNRNGLHAPKLTGTASDTRWYLNHTLCELNCLDASGEALVKTMSLKV